MGPLGSCFLPDSFKQCAINDRRLLARQNLIPVFDLADIEVVAQQVVQRAAPERDPAPRQAVDLVDDDDVDLPGADIVQQLLKVGTIGGTAGVPAIVIAGTGQGPACMGLMYAEAASY